MNEGGWGGKSLEAVLFLEGASSVFERGGR